MGEQGRLRRILDRDPVWCAYAIADLQPAYEPYCRWYLGSNEEEGVALIFSALALPTLFTAGPVADVIAAVEQIPLPRRIYLHVRQEHFTYLTRLYDCQADTRPMWRMALAGAKRNRLQPAGKATRLGSHHSSLLRSLYAAGSEFAPDAFEPYQLDAGVFFGVEDENGKLVAAGGTHIIDWESGVAAIGNMFTLPEHRRRGYAHAILHAIVTTLQSGGVETIILNVDQRNNGARTLYEEYGFEVYCPYIEGIGDLRA